jgi:hypothetical protein
MEYHRKQAKELVRAHRAGEHEATRRARAVLGSRASQRFLLSDAQYVVAREQGFRTWQELRRAHGASRAWIEREEVVIATDLVYGPTERVDVVVRKRGWKFDVTDGGRAAELTGRPNGWLAAAERVAEEHALNVNRRGVVFVQSNESRLGGLVDRVAACSRDVYEALLELGDRRPGDPHRAGG